MGRLSDLLGRRIVSHMKQKLLKEGTPITGTVMQIRAQGIQESSGIAVYISYMLPDGKEQTLRLVTEPGHSYEIGQEVPLIVFGNERDGVTSALPESLLQDKG